MKVSTLRIVLVLISLAARAKAAGTCGEKKSVVQQLIRNGYTAGAWPWHGALYHLQDQYRCGVTILTEQFVITAAHCTIDQSQGHANAKAMQIPASHVGIIVGISNLNTRDGHMQSSRVHRIIPHEEFNERTLEADIALIGLLDKIEFNNYVQPICLWRGDSKLDNIVNKIGYVVGWGYNEKNEYGNSLNEAPMPIVSKEDCIASDPTHYNMYYFDSKTICAGHRNGIQAARGDSGGGLFLRFGKHWVLRGIVSNVKTDPDTLSDDASSFVLFTDVSYYIGWIKSYIPITLNPPSSHPSGVSEIQGNLLNFASCGRDKYPSGTPEEMKDYLNQYPWLAVIEYINTNTDFLEDACHGVLIHPSFIVTAVHCVQRKTYSSIQSVRLNDYRLDTAIDIFEINGRTTRTMATRIPVQSVITHPNYNNPNFANNIALIKLQYRTSANPICLPPQGSILPDDKKFSIIGWKRNSRAEKPLMRNVVELANFYECRRQYAELQFQLDSTGGQVCSTISHDDDGESCSAYMGSAPLQYVRNGGYNRQYFLAAVSSFGHSDCRQYEFSDVFTNVAHYAGWIREMVRRYE